MDNYNSLIPNALLTYDMNNKKYSNFFNKCKYVNFTPRDDPNRQRIVTFFDSNKEKILASKYEILGVENISTETWIWAWAYPNYNKSETTISRQLLNYGFDIYTTEDIYLKSELITSRFRISNPIQIDIHVAIASYLTKHPIIFTYNVTDEALNIPNEIGLNMTPIIANEFGDKSILTKNYLFLLDHEKIDKYID